ncbi:hypothetical protein EVAR_49414_1 [Eumeta japonica]|uniref:Uncharacterized protein n=1 Tax=Eumeta variegata TaxID=151549 RepID=A0A4C1Y5A0_EUMVA|nr:hypothetical protein EVAR_49414_1 [Eumeta japonica]
MIIKKEKADLLRGTGQPYGRGATGSHPVILSLTNRRDPVSVGSRRVLCARRVSRSLRRFRLRPYRVVVVSRVLFFQISLVSTTRLASPMVVASRHSLLHEMKLCEVVKLSSPCLFQAVIPNVGLQMEVDVNPRKETTKRPSDCRKNLSANRPMILTTETLPKSKAKRRDESALKPSELSLTGPTTAFTPAQPKRS